MRRAGGALRSRTIVLCAAAVLVLLAFGLSGTVEASLVSSRAPAFTLTDVDGNTIRLSDFTGKITLLDFMYINCASCEIARPVLQDVYAAHSNVMAAISIDVLPLDTESGLRAYRDLKGIPWHVAKDTDGVQVKYEVSSVVHLVLINQDGVVIYEKTGMNVGEGQALRNEAEARIADALVGRAPDVSIVDIDGAPVNLTRLRGRIVLLEFMSIGNASSGEARRFLKEVYVNHSTLMSAVSIDVNAQDSESALRAYRDANGIPWQVARDTTNASDAFGVTTLPHIVLVSQGGLVVFKQRGFSSGSGSALRGSLETAIAALTPPPENRLQIASVLALTVVAALSSFFSPCSFPMFPGYMTTFLRLDSQVPGTRRRSRSVLYGVISAFGIILVYGIIWAILAALLILIGDQASGVVPALQPGVGVLLVVLGAAMFTSFQFNFLVNPFRALRQRILPKWTPNAVRTTSGKLFAYGVGYGAAGFACVAAPFIGAVSNGALLGGPSGALAVFLLYSALVITIMIAVTLVLATFGQAALKKLNKYTEAIKKASAVVLIIAGAYLIYYWYSAWVATAG